MATIKVHKNFQRFNEEDDDYETEEKMKKFQELIFEKIGGNIVTLPREDDEFEHFDESMINFENFDRLYYIYYTKDGNAHEDKRYKKNFELIGRMNFNGKYVFIQVKGWFKGDDDILDEGSYIFLCVDANLLIKAIPYEPTLVVHQSLSEEGIQIGNIYKEKYGKYLTYIIIGMYPFCDLSPQSFEDLKRTLKQRKYIIPKYLLDNIDDFIEYYEVKFTLWEAYLSIFQV